MGDVLVGPSTASQLNPSVFAFPAPFQVGGGNHLGPQFPLMMWRRVSDTARSITFALKGNIDGLRDLFNQGLASPWDVSDSRGFSLMRVGYSPFLFELAKNAEIM